MAEIKVHLDLNFSSRAVRWGMVGAMLLVAAPELASESVTLTTYYPAPSGVYTQLISTTKTWLARDGGWVDIGTSGAPSGGTVLSVAGPTVMGNSAANAALSAGNATLAVVGQGTTNPDLTVNGSILVGNDGNMGSGLWLDGSNRFFFGHAGFDAVGVQIGGTSGLWPFLVSDQGYIGMNGNVGINEVPPKYPLDVGGDVRFSSTVQAADPSCSAGVDWTQTPTCSPGWYATTIEGIYSTRIELGNTPGTDQGVAGGGEMICCPCPLGGCTL
jgi:hypothetical protein